MLEGFRQLPRRTPPARIAVQSVSRRSALAKLDTLKTLFSPSFHKSPPNITKFHLFQSKITKCNLKMRSYKTFLKQSCSPAIIKIGKPSFVSGAIFVLIGPWISQSETLHRKNQDDVIGKSRWWRHDGFSFFSEVLLVCKAIYLKNNLEYFSKKLANSRRSG